MMIQARFFPFLFMAADVKVSVDPCVALVQLSFEQQEQVYEQFQEGECPSDEDALEILNWHNEACEITEAVFKGRVKESCCYDISAKGCTQGVGCGSD